MHFDTKNPGPGPGPGGGAGGRAGLGAGDDEPAFGSELRRLRRAAGLTMEQLAEASGVSARSISNMERGRTLAPHRRTVAVLAKALRLPARDRELLEELARTFPALPSGGDPRTELLGRQPELARLKAALHAAQRLRGSALVLRGGPGLGKTALLREALALGSVQALTVLSVTGVPAETHLPFTGLRRLLDPLLADAGPRTRAACRLVLQAVGEEAADGGLEPYGVALATVDLVTSGPRRPARLLVVDDAQWLDRQSWDAIAFLARRIAAHPVTVLMAMRDSTETSLRLATAGLSELAVEPLGTAASAALVDRTAPGLAAHLRARVLEESAGHPLALIDLSSAVAGTGWDPVLNTGLPLSDRLARSYTTTLHTLPATTSAVLQTAALHDGDSTDEILAAAATVIDPTLPSADDPREEPHAAPALRGLPLAGPSLADLQPALDAHLLTETPGRIRYRHPLIREAVRQSVPASLRPRIHAALAAVLGPRTDRGVWHRVAAATGTDEELAADLAELARTLRSKGVYATALTSWERAADLTADPEQRATHLYWAREAARSLGDTDQIVKLTGVIDDALLPPAVRATYLKSRENALQAGWSPSADLTSLPASVSRLHAQGQTDVAADLLGQVSLRCFWAPPDAATRAALIASAEGLGLPPLSPHLYNIRAHIAPLERGRIVLDTVTALAREPAGDPGQEYPSLGFPASAVCDYPAAKAFLTADTARHRAKGAIGNLAETLVSQTYVAAQLGEIATALASAREAQVLAGQLGRVFWVLAARICEAQAEALQGNAETALALADQVESALLAYGPHPHLSLVQLARGTAYLAQGRSTDAYDALARIFDPHDAAHQEYVSLAVMPVIAEAGGTSPERREDLRALVRAAESAADLCGWPVLVIGLAQAKARLAEGDEADKAFELALSATPATWPFERARTQLAYGAWLRRHRHAARSRPHLQAAWHTFRAMSATPWAQRADAELRAAGAAQPSARPPAGAEGLTAQELQIARLAATGMTNRQIGEQLDLSPRTVSTHLYRAYPKLGVSSRRQLPHALPPDQSPPYVT
ncbi:LuxR C-terminal-related transcriptional regulator [Streptomyces sp. V4-01]|uniref:LuxR C-terminal-related transcriptional regulator n=1 Tax=Actinacidiphila polyblastidii TaxID=3110430 RepID=A0ABU7PK28_9ACTN|nr:LuxR C-terminal-related transcriptional regulator [Streptomyces sp. V4-01]